MRSWLGLSVFPVCPVVTVHYCLLQALASSRHPQITRHQSAVLIAYFEEQLQLFRMLVHARACSVLRAKRTCPNDCGNAEIFLFVAVIAISIDCDCNLLHIFAYHILD